MTQITAERPKTLLQLAGAKLRPPALDQSVLVLVDVQNEYVDGVLPLAGVDAAINDAARLLASARAAGTPVIHVVHHSVPGGPAFAPDTRGAEIVPELTPLPSEEVIVKRAPNAFANTPLRARLEHYAETGRTSMILAGFMTHMCISSTARAALDLGIPTTVVAGATATRDLPDPLGGAIKAETVQATALAELADRFACVVADADALAEASVP